MLETNADSVKNTVSNVIGGVKTKTLSISAYSKNETFLGEEE
jgi:hypothetical protein